MRVHPLCALQHRKLAAGEVAIEQGQPGSAFYVIRSGSVDINVTPSGGGAPNKVNALSSLPPLGNALPRGMPSSPQRSSLGATCQVKTLTSGEFFGERSILKAEPANASVVAAEPTDLIGLTKTDFEALLGPLQDLMDRTTREVGDHPA